MTNMIPLVIAYILNIIDYIFTSHWVRKFGIDIEANPFGRWMFENNVAWLFKIVISGILFIIIGIYIYHKPAYSWISYIILAAFIMLTIYHIIIFIKIWNINHQ